MVPKEVARLIEQGALFVVNTSAGKDSQAMTILLERLVPRNQLLLIHADLGRVEWPGNVEHIQKYSDLPLIVCRNENKDFLSMVRARGMFPDPARRQCTSDLKRGPIEREIRRFLKSRPEFEGRIVNCMGMRAQESAARSKRPVLKFNERNSKAGREWWDWLPIHEFTVEEVFETIADAGQEPHWAYKAGMSRLSCSFCIMANKCDLRKAAELRPDLYREYVELEAEVGHKFTASKSLAELAGIPVQVEAFQE